MLALLTCFRREARLARKVNSSTMDSYPSVSAKEAVRQWQADVEVDCFQNAHFHLDEVPSRVGIVANVQEIVDAGRTPFLMVVRR